MPDLKFEVFQEFSKMNLSPLAIDTIKLLDLPPICMCCGSSTKHSLSIKPEYPNNKKEDIALGILSLAFAPLELVRGVMYLAKPNAKIPICWSCHIDHFLPDRNVIWLIGLLFVFLGSSFYSGLNEKYGFMLLYVTLSIVTLIYLGRKNMPHHLRTFPVHVFLHENGYRYLIFGGPVFDYMTEHLRHQKIEKQQ